MPAVDYEARAKASKERLFANKDISQKDKDDLERFLKQYKVSPARENIFYSHIGLFLEHTKDVSQDMHNQDKINDIFDKLGKKLSLSYWNTILNVSRRFTTWLNDGVKPKGFKDLKAVSRKKQRRKLSKEDMLDWNDFLKLSKTADTILWSAITTVQGDGGFRPSEFTDLNYGSITQKGKFMIAEVDGKTGERGVTLYKSVPFLQRWMDKHATKKANDPLWIEENPKKGKDKTEVQRYSYPAMAKKLKHLGVKAGIKKPLDWYSTRHSSCYITKKENMPIDLAAEKYGHSTDYFVNVYGRLDADDMVERHSKHYKEKKGSDEDIDKPIECSVCGFINEPKKEICEKCRQPLTLKKALEDTKRISDLEKDIAQMKLMFKKKAIIQIAKKKIKG